MTKKEKKIILILLIVVAIIVVAMVISISKKGKVKGNEEKNETNVEEFVQTLDDGTRLNTSTKLQETKKVGNLEISKLQLTAKNNETILLGIITNVGTAKEENILLKIKIVDKQGNELTTVKPYIGYIKAGESTQLNVSTTFDYANAYDFIVSINE